MDISIKNFILQSIIIAKSAKKHSLSHSPFGKQHGKNEDYLMFVLSFRE